MNETGNCLIGTVMGRYYSMGRSRNWELTDTAYKCIVNADGRTSASAEEAVKESYDKDKTPDNVDMFDEYIPPYVINEYDGVKDGDCVFHTNYRQDRAIQLSMAFVEDDYEGKREIRPDVFYMGFTRINQSDQPGRSQRNKQALPCRASPGRAESITDALHPRPRQVPIGMPGCVPQQRACHQGAEKQGCPAEYRKQRNNA